MKKILILILLLSFTAGVKARTAADFFVEAPVSVLPVLAGNTRLDMLDYFASGLATSSGNVLGGRARVLENGPAKLVVELSRDASMQIAVLPMRSDTLIAVVETVLTPVADSAVRFYRASDWEPLRVQPAMPSVTDYVPRESRKEAAATEMPPFAFSRVDFDADKGTFTFVNTTAAYYDDSELPAGLALMRPRLEMRFDGRRFVETVAADKP